MSSACRSDDLSRINGQVGNLIMLAHVAAGLPPPTKAFTKTNKAQKGAVGSPETARLLCPIEDVKRFDGDPEW
jgi:hypothetical protein